MKAWGILATLGFAVLAFGLGQLTGAAAMLAFTKKDLASLAEDGTALAVVALIGNAIQTVTVVLAARLAGTSAMRYLAFDWPRWRDVGIAFVALAVLIAGSDLATYALGKDIVTPFQLAINRGARADGTLTWLWLAIVVAAPAGEEILFRGFMFRGFVSEPRNALPAIVVIALIWAALHLGQYDLFSVAVVGIFGIVLGYARYLTGSVLLTITMHLVYNLESQIETYIVLGWL
jgi:uncharacterized protein